MDRVRSMAKRLASMLLASATTAVLLFGVSTPTAATSGASTGNVDPGLLAEAKANPSASFDVIVSAVAPPRHTRGTNEQVLAAEGSIRAAGGKARGSLGIVGGAAATVKGAHIIALSHDPLVSRVIKDVTFSTSWSGPEAAAAAGSSGIQTVNAPAVWSNLGLAGQGVAVAVLDSGVADHPDLGARVIARADLTGENNFGDPGGHGTHVAGLIAGDGSASGGLYTGVAPQTNIVSVRVINATGHAALSTVLAGMQWILLNRTTYNIRVVNMSFGALATSGYMQDVLAGAAEVLNFAGLTVVVAAGNAGPAQSTITTPAIDPFVVSVGADDDAGTATLANDSIPSWSSQGPTAFDAIAKPDLVAPGRHLVSLRAAGSTLDTGYPSHQITAPGASVAQYFMLSGTSTSAALVSGAAALIAQRYPNEGPRHMKGRLIENAHPLAGVAATAQGAGVVDAYAALTASSSGAAATMYPPSAAFANTLRPYLVGQPLSWRDLTWNGGHDSAGLPWASVTWADITWNDVTWQDLTWEAFNWPSVAWLDITWQDMTWESTTTTGAGGGWALVD